MYSSNRQIRVFISSTFRDMQQERNYLISHIFPRIRIYCQQRSIVFTEIDLRWGITERQAENGQVIELCLDEIDRSHPFFIGLIGDRYGYVPTHAEIERGNSLLTRHEWIRDAVEQHQSITEIEIQYGVLRSSDPIYGHFFLRGNDTRQNPQTPEQHRLEQLKNAIRNQGKIPYSTYTSVETLGEMIYDSLISTIDKLYPDPILSDYERQTVPQQALRTEHLKHYIPIDDTIRQLEAFAQDLKTRHFMLTGANGCGKTTLLCEWERISQQPVIAYYIGASSVTESPTEILKYLIHTICRRFNIKHYDIYRPSVEADEQYQLTAELLTVCRQTTEPWILLIDGIDRLQTENDCSMIWIPELPDHIKTIYSTRIDSPAYKYSRQRNDTLCELTQLDAHKRSEIATDYFAAYGKTLPPQLLNRLATTCSATTPYAYLTVLDEIRKYGSHETLEMYIDNYCNNENEKQLYAMILGHLESFGDERFDTAFRKLCTFLSISRSGLTERELMDLCSMAPMTWAAIHSRLYIHLTHSGGLIRPADPVFAEALREHYVIDTHVADQYRQTIIRYFIGTRDTPSYDPKREHEELAWQLLQTGSFEDLNRIAIRPDTFDSWYRKDMQTFGECSLFWDALESHGYTLTALAPENKEQIPLKKLLSLNNVCHFCLKTGRTADFDRLYSQLGRHYKVCMEQDMDAGIIGFVHLLQLRQEVAFGQGDYEESEHCIQEAQELLTQHYDQVEEQYNRLCFDYYLIGTYNDLGNVYAITDRHAQAGICYDKAANYKPTADIDHLIESNKLVALGNLAFLHFTQGDSEQGWKEIRQAESLARNFSNQSLIASIALKKGKMCDDDDQAIAYYRQAIEIYASMPSKYVFQQATALTEAAQRFCNRKDFEHAEQYYLQALELLEKPEANRELYLKTRYDLVGFFMSTQQFAKAEASAKKLVNELESIFRPDFNESWWLADTLRALAYAKSAQSDFKESLALFERSRETFCTLRSRLASFNPSVDYLIGDVERQINRIKPFFNL